MTKKYGVEFKKQFFHAYMQRISYSQLEKEYVVVRTPFLDK